jgi:hypothetical protein
VLRSRSGVICPPASALFSSDSSYAHARFEPDQLGMAIVTTGLSYRERMLWTGNRTRHAVSVTSQKAYYGKSTRTRPPQQSTSIGTKAWTPCRNSIAFGRFARYTTAWASEFPADVCRQILEASKNSAYACISTFSGHQYLDRLYSIAPPPPKTGNGAWVTHASSEAESEHGSRDMFACGGWRTLIGNRQYTSSECSLSMKYHARCLPQ